MSRTAIHWNCTAQTLTKTCEIFFYFMFPLSPFLILIYFFSLAPFFSPLFEPGSSVSIVSDYGLDNRAIEVRSPSEAKGFFL
jgi:hypothetical protein